MIAKITAYKTSDGKFFDTLEQAQEYEYGGALDRLTDYIYDYAPGDPDHESLDGRKSYADREIAAFIISNFEYIVKIVQG
jgi:hypothetical protein